jgi:endoplasmic reticulum-Golgi intermediate compartment protein 2
VQRVLFYNLDLDNFQYFLGIVPTIYVDETSLFGGWVVTNQYAVTEFNHAIDEKKPDAVPGVFLKYQIEPIAVRVTQFRPGFIQFVTRTCGIVGGIFVTAGVLFRFVFWIQKRFQSS